ncbi:diacylglycerol kinase [Schnuerera sp. xch1]|uniref:diacylglycerol kinase n=1 Tax=Schnuerera sp. xch1 TaxID=2874283 RepID=UPI001CBF0B0F|nr:diacylglycerol kinase [Schnuerera sp. xch1]MBZ2175727.1 diacylglycerol kinase [Schnuerera sp. xch1]
MKKSKNLIESFNYAVNGIIYALKTEKNLRIHFLIATGIIIMSLFFDFTRIELIVLFVSITLVLLAEMINTAVERTIDILTKDYHPLARLAKDLAAGGVLIAAFNALVVGYLLFFDRLNPITHLVLFKMKNSPIHLTFIALVLIIVSTIGIKAICYKGKGTPFQGGTVSGHSAVSFCIATIIAFVANNMLVSTLAFIVAFLVGESRVEGKIHSILEVISGALLGIIVGILVFQLI